MDRRIKKALMHAFLLFLIGGVSVSPVMGGNPETCTREDAIKAETQEPAKSWDELYASFRRYHQCDDGAIAEGYSDNVATLMAEHWNELGKFKALAIKNPKFERFVLRHLDETMSSSQGQTIMNNVRQKCSPSLIVLCKKIKARMLDIGAK